MVSTVGHASQALAQAANYEPIRVDVGLGVGHAPGVSAAGFGIVAEPKYLLTDNIALGARIEGLVTFGASIDSGGGDTSLGSGTVGATLLKAEYLLGDLPLRPVAGLAAGLYGIGGQELRTTDDGASVSNRGGKYFGIGPQVALELGRARFAVTYHMIVGATIEVEQTNGGFEDFSQNYYLFELSFHLGGGRKKAPPTSEPTGP